MQTRGQIVKLLSSYSDMTYQEIGEIIGCTRQRVQQVAREAGLSHESCLYRTDITVERVLELYYRSTLRVQDIAGIFGCCANTISNRLRAAGVSPSESYSRRSKLYWRRVREATRVVAK